MIQSGHGQVMVGSSLDILARRGTGGGITRHAGRHYVLCQGGIGLVFDGLDFLVFLFFFW